MYRWNLLYECDTMNVQKGLGFCLRLSFTLYCHGLPVSKEEKKNIKAIQISYIQAMWVFCDLWIHDSPNISLDVQQGSPRGGLFKERHAVFITSQMCHIKTKSFGHLIEIQTSFSNERPLHWRHMWPSVHPLPSSPQLPDASFYCQTPACLILTSPRVILSNYSKINVLVSKWKAGSILFTWQKKVQLFYLIIWTQIFALKCLTRQQIWFVLEEII